MIQVQISRTDLDTLETNPQMAFRAEYRCEHCLLPFLIVFVMLGSPGDHALEREKLPSPWYLQSWQRSDIFRKIFHKISDPESQLKKVRVRFRPAQLDTLRRRQPLTAKSVCPYCQQRFDLRVMIA
jgi:hypothetical protein